MKLFLKLFLFRFNKKAITGIVTFLLLLDVGVLTVSILAILIANLIISILINIMDGKEKFIEIHNDVTFMQQLQYVRMIDTVMGFTLFMVFEMCLLAYRYF